MSVPRSAPARRGGAGALIALGLACAALTALVFALAVHTAEGQRLDEAARGGDPLGGSPAAAEATRRLLDTISVGSLALFGLGIMAIALARGRPGLAAGAGIAVLGANVTTQLAKDHFDRPDLIGTGASGAGAFPSGHVTVAMSLATALVLVVPPALRATAALAGCAYATGVGAAVIALDWHRPSEVIGGFLVATGWAALVAAVLVLAREGAGRRGTDGLGGRAALVGLALVVAFAALVAIAASRRVDVADVARDRSAYLASVTVCGLACLALGGSLVLALGRARPRPRRRRGR